MEESLDLIVAGAGPAGCVVAAKAAIGGARVLMLEKEHEPGLGRDWIVDVGRETFAEAGVPAPGEAELFFEPELTAIVTSDRQHIVELLPPPMIPVRNGPYVKKLAGWARECGVEIRCGVKVAGPLLEGDAVRGVLLEDEDGPRAMRSLIVADCTGIAGTIRRRTPSEWDIGDDLSPDDIVLARRETREIDVAAARDVMKKAHMWDGIRYDRVGSQGVYSVETFFVDLEKGFIDILIGTKPGSGPTPEERFDSIVEQFGFIGGKVFGDGGPIPIRRPLDTFAAPGLVCIGDCACQVIPAHGSGTASAILAADLAASVILRAVETGRADRPSLWGYCHAFQSGRGAVLAYYDVIRKHTTTLRVEDLNMMIAKGLVSAPDIYSGLVPELPAVGAGWLARRLGAGYVPPGLLMGVASAGALATMTSRHYHRYPPLDLPGAFDSWVRTMPGRRASQPVASA